MGKDKSAPRDVEEQIEKLREKIRYHDHKYFVENAQEISDHEYDLLMEQLEELEKQHPDLVTPDSPTQRIGGEPLAAFKAVRHAVPMLSIEKALSAEKLLPFDKRVHEDLARKGNREKVQYVVEPKVDGVALSLRYEKGILTLAATRGNGKEGDDVTQNVRTVHAIPAELHTKEPPDVLEIRGEAYMSYKSLEKCNQKRKEAGAPLFANPRNATAGSLKLLDSRITAKRGLLFFAYAVGETKGISFETQWEILTALIKFGLPVNPHKKLCSSIEEVIGLTKDWDKLRSTLDYAWDGMVIKVSSLKQQELLGVTSKAPVAMRAFKFEPEKATTRLLDVDWQVGRTGTLTPVARLEPVHLAGTTVANASLHNVDEIRKKSMHLGDDVVIEKAGEIIPQVVKVAVHHKGREIAPPQICPVCREKLLVDEHKEEAYEKIQYRCTNQACIRAEDWKTVPRRKGIAKKPTQCLLCKSPVEISTKAVPETVNTTYRCVFPLCPAMLRERIVFFASRPAMDIQGLGPAVAEILVEKRFVKSLADIFTLESKKRSLVEIEGRGELSVGMLLNAIEESKNRGLARLLTGLGIPNVGRDTAEALATAFQRMDAVQDGGADDITCEDMLEFFGNVRADKVIDELEKAKVKVTHLTKWYPAGYPREKAERQSYFGKKLHNLPAIIEKRLKERIVPDSKARIEAFRESLGIGENDKSAVRESFSDPETFFSRNEVHKLLELLGFFLAPHTRRLTPPQVREIALHFASRHKGHSEKCEIPLEEFRRYISRVAYFLPTAAQEDVSTNMTRTHAEGVGLVVAQSIVDFFDTFDAAELIERLRKTGVKMESEAKRTETGILSGKTLVVTGTLKNYGREQIQSRIRSLGGRASGDVGKGVDYLIVGDSPGATKLEKAATLNVQQLTEDEFERMITEEALSAPVSNKGVPESKPGQKKLFEGDK